MSDNALALRSSVVRSIEDVERVAVAMAKSGYFQDSREAAQAVVKILAGQEMGFGPFASMTGVYIISGRPSVSANLMGAAVKRSGKYNYRVVEMTDKSCTIDFYEGSEKTGSSTFTDVDARKAGTKNMDKFPRNMLYARAMSNGVRWFCPDVFSAPTYTPEELGADVTEDGDIINAVVVETTQHATTQPTKPAAQPAAPVEQGDEPKDWPTKVLQHFVTEYKAPSNQWAKNMLNLSGLPKNTDIEVLKRWVVEYKKARAEKTDKGADLYTPQEAAAKVNETFKQ